MATLDFKGKALVQNYHLSVKYHELVPKRDRSLTDKVRLDDNLIIHGDNLKALKALLPTYAGQVKCIYIDPPYNTGNEGWAYNDKVNSPMMQEWLGKAVDRDDLTRHDKWLCMMLPRLKLLKELLADDGAIFVSIADHELHRLRSIMDEVFGESQFVANFVWKSRAKPSNIGDKKKKPQQVSEYILCYAKGMKGEDKTFGLILSGEDRSYPHKLGNRPYRLQTILKSNRGGNQRDTMRFTIAGFTPNKGQRWQGGEAHIQKLHDTGHLEFRDGIPFLRYFEDEENPEHNPIYTFVQPTISGTAEHGKIELNEIIGENHGLDTVKPLALIKWLFSFAAEKDALVLDSFAGSATTAHAVLALNKEDGGNRKFILVECEDYADTITAERVRRVIKGVKGASDENLKKGLGGTFSYFELGKAIELDSILDGKNLPSYLELARYVFYTATGEEFDERKVNEKRSFVGESKTHEVYLFYQPDLDYLKKTALTLERAESLGKLKTKRRLVFAPTKYLDQEQLDALRIDFAQLPFEIYKLAT
jgi:adenine-specific DNA-methyltransferase